ncbi:peptidylprolyl isomerase [Vibrio cholerae]|nr:peptidylprolyl isomerase [Vibrio cholerae]EGR0537590.1 peptidylprolyl isomerase [Vibrio cholerae]EGR2309618.1 peptidylprolyl isomerase [Vibrio cholerae]EGR3953516.1 peptidylprolyl isomerase [Vibrio cholerae]EGR3989114.1 peptidylprolyl isomerase [Vibrio cholerae]
MPSKHVVTGSNPVGRAISSRSPDNSMSYRGFIILSHLCPTLK